MSDPEAPADALLDSAPCGFLSFSDDGRLRIINRTLLDLLGYARPELEGRHVEEILNVGSGIFYQTHLFPLLRLHGHADEIFLLLRPRAGEEIAVLATAVRRQRKGEWRNEMALLRLQERRKFEDALVEARRVAEEARAVAESANAQLERQRTLAEEANRAKSGFLAMMSHELRTPLNAIGGYVQLLEMGVHGPVTEAQAEALGRVARSQQRLLRLINDLLDLARIEAGKIEYEMQRIEVGEIVQAAAVMMEPQLAARSLRFETSVPPGLVVHADREKAEQILLNLLSNANKFTPAGGSVTLHAMVAADRGDAVEISVADTGVGIPDDQLAGVFEPFVQAHSTARAQGTGLGLSISRELARGMGGDLAAQSRQGKGSTFTLTLRRASVSS